MKNNYKYLLAFGSNVGDRKKNLLQGINYIENFVIITRQTSWIETEPLKHPIYFTDDHEYYTNFVCEAESSMLPNELYKNIVEIENTIGHPREKRWMPRALDIDLLFCCLNENKAFEQCTPLPFSEPPDFFVPHRDYFHRPFWRDMVEKGLQIPEENLRKHF